MQSTSSLPPCRRNASSVPALPRKLSIIACASTALPSAASARASADAMLSPPDAPSDTINRSSCTTPASRKLDASGICLASFKTLARVISRGSPSGNSQATAALRSATVQSGETSTLTMRSSSATCTETRMSTAVEARLKMRERRAEDGCADIPRYNRACARDDPRVRKRG